MLTCGPVPRLADPTQPKLFARGERRVRGSKSTGCACGSAGCGWLPVNRPCSRDRQSPLADSSPGACSCPPIGWPSLALFAVEYALLPRTAVKGENCSMMAAAKISTARQLRGAEHHRLCASPSPSSLHLSSLIACFTYPVHHSPGCMRNDAAKPCVCLRWRSAVPAMECCLYQRLSRSRATPWSKRSGPLLGRNQ